MSRQHKPNKKGNKFLNDPQRSGYHSARHGRQNPTVSCRINFGLRLSLATCILLVARMQCGSSNQPPDIYSRNDKCSGGRMTRTALHTSRFCRKCPSFFFINFPTRNRINFNSFNAFDASAKHWNSFKVRNVVSFAAVTARSRCLSSCGEKKNGTNFLVQKSSEIVSHTARHFNQLEMHSGSQWNFGQLKFVRKWIISDSS